MKKQTIASAADLDRLEGLIEVSALAAVHDLKALLDSRSALDVLAILKFSSAGKDPLDSARPLNIIEQINQSFTYLASFAAARWLLARYPNCAPLLLNLGAASGSDIQSECGQFVAETFAVTHPGSNDKLRKDIAKVRQCAALHKFVFFLSPGSHESALEPGVTVVQLDHAVLAELGSVLRES